MTPIKEQVHDSGVSAEHFHTTFWHLLFTPLHNNKSLGLPNNCDYTEFFLSKHQNLPLFNVIRHVTATRDPDIATVQSINFLDLSQSELASLDGLQYAVNLNTLIVGSSSYQSHLISLQQLSNLELLEVLDLRSTKVVDLFPLRNLSNLKKIILDDTEFADLKPLSSVVSLTLLSIKNTNVFDLEPLLPLINLVFLDVSNCRLLPREVQGKYVVSRNFSFFGFKIPNIFYQNVIPSVVGKFESIQDLIGQCFNNQFLIESVGQYLPPNIELSKVSFAKFKVLNFSFSPLSTLDGIQFATNLRNLSISGCRIFDLTPISNLKNLEVLRINKTKVTSINETYRLVNIRKLDCSYSALSCVNVCSLFTKLESLNLKNTDVTIENLRWLKKLENLRYLNISGCLQIPDYIREHCDFGAVHGRQDIASVLFCV
ncbi:hypothetical protein RCL1_002653 [Eukaryota sp. TZLM3-RCL]